MGCAWTAPHNQATFVQPRGKQAQASLSEHSPDSGAPAFAVHAGNRAFRSSRSVQLGGKQACPLSSQMRSCIASVPLRCASPLQPCLPLHRRFHNPACTPSVLRYVDNLPLHAGLAAPTALHSALVHRAIRTPAARCTSGACIMARTRSCRTCSLRLRQALMRAALSPSAAQTMLDSTQVAHLTNSDLAT